MKIITTLCAVAVLMVGTSADAQVRVKGHFRKDGTYVMPHVRSAPNSSRLDNYSTRGNVNPYTGEKGYASPYPPITAPRYVPPPVVRQYTAPQAQPRKPRPKLRCYGYGC